MTRNSNERTYLFALTDAGGTVPPELGVVRRVVERGHRVTVLADGAIFRQVVEAMVAPWRASGVTRVVGIESRGWIFASAVACSLHCSHSPSRPPWHYMYWPPLTE